MKNRRKFMDHRLFLIVVISVLIYPISASAIKDYAGGRWERGFFMGVGLGAALFVDDNNMKTEPKSSLDVQFGYDVWKYISVGTRLGVMLAEGQVYDPLVNVNSWRSVSTFYFDFFVKGKPLYTRLAPYIVVAVGVYDRMGQGYYGQAIDLGGVLHVQTGAGLEFNISRRNTVAVEATYNYLNSSNSTGIMNMLGIYRFTF